MTAFGMQVERLQALIKFADNHRCEVADQPPTDVPEFVDRDRDDRRLGVPRVDGMVSLGEDARERIYVVALDSGAVYRLDPG